jgi:hypothetical protein
MGRGGGQSLNISCLANPPPATRRFFSVMTSFADHRETDLFGQPVRPNKGRRGRPALQVTNEGRDMLEMACARGWPNARIAEAVGISVPSLKRDPVRCNRPVRGAGAGSWHPDPSFADLSRGLARAAGRPRQPPGQACEARIGVPASRASASNGAVAPDGIGRPGARASPPDRPAKLGSGCQLPAPAPLRARRFPLSPDGRAPRRHRGEPG